MFDLPINRPDEPNRLIKHKDMHKGKKALIILGGPSGERWQEVCGEINPDVIITTNSAKHIPANYWILGENLNRAYIGSLENNQRDKRYLKVLIGDNRAKYKLVNWQNWMPNLHKGIGSVGDALLTPDRFVIRFNRTWRDAGFGLRNYRQGLLLGKLFEKRAQLGCRTDWSVGGVVFQALHWAGIIGVSEVHTVGLDLCFPNGRDKSHHWWLGLPDYEVDAFRTEDVFTSQYGVDTQWDWVEAAEYIQELRQDFDLAQLDWKDHSNGLLQRMKVWCAHETA